MTEPVQLVIAPGRVRRDAHFHLMVFETGEVLASHICSHYGFAKGDLYQNRPERLKEFKERFGDFKVNFIDELGVMEEEMIEKNQKFADSQGWTRKLK